MDFPDKEPIITYSHYLRSRYGETDRMGYVYYGRYLEYFEVARTEMIRSYGISYREMEESGVMLPVIHAELEYKQPVLYDEEIEIRVQIFEKPSVRLRTFYEVRSEGNDQPHVTGEVSLCFMDSETRRPRRAPEDFLRKIEQHLKK
ncbi:acyl-CoA thioesterase [Balneola sp. MJW-20]|uniref:acyl-CoA thioesterase n=1 Tax=Gracilimonas aurantiaca TaxID=3234185 RepID=UPI0034665AE3